MSHARRKRINMVIRRQGIALSASFSAANDRGRASLARRGGILGFPFSTAVARASSSLRMRQSISCVNRSYWRALRNELTKEYVKTLPRSKNIFRTHMGSQWNGERYSLVADRFANMASLAYQTGMKGMTIFGEVSSFNPANEINYLAFSRFSWNPLLGWDDFLRNDLAPILGGVSEAFKFLELLEVKEDRASLLRALNEAREIARLTNGDVYRRWVQLQDRLYMKSEMLGTA